MRQFFCTIRLIGILNKVIVGFICIYYTHTMLEVGLMNDKFRRLLMEAAIVYLQVLDHN
jgi:hypothetical protein